MHNFYIKTVQLKFDESMAKMLYIMQNSNISN